MPPVRVALLAAVLLAAGAQAAVEVVSVSTLTTGATSPPVRLEIGAGGATARYFSPLTLSPNATILAGTLVARAGADLAITDAARIVNAHPSAQSVTLSSAQLAQAAIEAFEWRVYNGTTLVGALDLRGASPSVSFTLPPSASYRLDARLDLADGAGNHTAPPSFELRLRVGSGGITLSHTASAPTLGVHSVTVPFRPLLAGSAVGANSTNASATVNAPTLVQNTQHAFFVNNTATSASFVKLTLTSSSSIADVSTAILGIDNGTASVDHLRIVTGIVTQPSGSWQRLEPTSTARLYVTSLEGALFDGATLSFDMLTSDTVTGASHTLTKGRITLT